MNELSTPMLMMRSFKLCCECDAHTMQIKSTHTHIYTHTWSLQSTVAAARKKRRKLQRVNILLKTMQHKRGKRRSEKNFSIENCSRFNWAVPSENFTNPRWLNFVTFKMPSSKSFHVTWHYQSQFDSMLLNGNFQFLPPHSISIEACSGEQNWLLK